MDETIAEPWDAARRGLKRLQVACLLLTAGSAAFASQLFVPHAAVVRSAGSTD